jgi:hypothetical protein
MADNPVDRQNFLERYAEHSSRLQTWIGAYGAGLASLLVYQYRTAVSDARALLQTTSVVAGTTSFSIQAQIEPMHHALVVSLTLIAVGLALQVILLFLNKWSQFKIAHAPDRRAGWTPSQTAANWFSEQFWFDGLCDVGSALLLGIATYLGVRALGLIS